MKEDHEGEGGSCSRSCCCCKGMTEDDEGEEGSCSRFCLCDRGASLEALLTAAGRTF